MIVEEKDLVGQLAWFPVQVVQRMVDLQFQQTGKYDVSVFQKDKTALSAEGGFYWCNTPKDEGYYFWIDVIRNKKFDIFFEKYPPITIADIKGEIEGIPVHIVQRMCEHQVNQGNAYDVTVFHKSKTANNEDNGFDWGKTHEDSIFWRMTIFYGHFNRFNDLPRFPAMAQLPSNTTEQPAEDPTPYQNCAPAPLTFPRLMHVSDWEDMHHPRIRLVEKIEGGYYWAWRFADELDSQKDKLMPWKYAKEIEQTEPDATDTPAETVDPPVVEEPKDLVFPMVMEVSENEDFSYSQMRVVVFKNAKGYCATANCESIAELDQLSKTHTIHWWPYARVPQEKPKPIIIEMTHEQIAEKLGIDPAFLKITP